MANALNRTIQPGEVVMLDRNEIIDTVYDLRFKCESGFGMSHFTIGSAIYGTFLQDGEKDRIEGYMIDPITTEEYSKEIHTQIPLAED